MSFKEISSLQMLFKSRIKVDTSNFCISLILSSLCMKGMQCGIVVPFTSKFSFLHSPFEHAIVLSYRLVSSSSLFNDAVNTTCSFIGVFYLHDVLICSVVKITKL